MRSLLNITRNLVLVVMATTFMANVATAQMLSKAELKKLVAVANSQAEHERLARHYDAKAAELEADAKDHDELALEYRKNPQGHDSKHPMSPMTATHCEYLAKEARAAAQTARKMAADHRQMGKTPVK